jgi:hypothetical protein
MCREVRVRRIEEEENPIKRRAHRCIAQDLSSNPLSFTQCMSFGYCRFAISFLRLWRSLCRPQVRDFISQNGFLSSNNGRAVTPWRP